MTIILPFLCEQCGAKFLHARDVKICRRKHREIRRWIRNAAATLRGLRLGEPVVVKKKARPLRGAHLAHHLRTAYKIRNQKKREERL